MSQQTFIADPAAKAVREPLAAGLFGQRGSVAAHVAGSHPEATGGPLSLNEFEDRYQSGFIAPRRDR